MPLHAAAQLLQQEGTRNEIFFQVHSPVSEMFVFVFVCQQAMFAYQTHSTFPLHLITPSLSLSLSLPSPLSLSN